MTYKENKLESILFLYKIIIIILITIISILCIKNFEKDHQIDDLNYDIKTLNNDITKIENEALSYKFLYTSQDNEFKEMKINFLDVKKELDELKNQIYLSKEREKNISRGNYKYKDLSKYEIMTVSELNKWIKERAPEGSPFIGRAADFLLVSARFNKDPKYIIAHAATESDWGRSSIALMKGNYFGITAYNTSPGESAKDFSGDFQNKISRGIEWIDSNFFKKGKTSLASMQSGYKTAYAQNADGTPCNEWTNTILGIIYK